MDHGPPAIFVGDALGLDFLNSIATPVDTPIDWIDDGEGLLHWLAQAQLVPAARSSGCGHRPSRASSTRSPTRRGICANGSGGSCGTQGRPLAAKNLDELESLNRLLERDDIFSRIVAGQSRSSLLHFR